MKFQEKIKAINLRKLGRSYSEIIKKVKVSKSTLSLWLRDVKLTIKQKKRLYVTLKQENAYKLAKMNQKNKVKKIKKIIAQADKELKNLINNSLFLAGLMLYCAEGDKSDEREAVKFSNSDPIMIKFMMKWFREICNVPEEKFRLALHIHELHCRKDIESYWSKLANIPLNQFHKTQVKPTSLGQRKNILYNGTCSICVHNKDLYRRIKGWKIGFFKKI